MGKITQKLPNKDEIPKLKRRHRRKDLDDIHSRILKTKRKSNNEKEKYNEDGYSKQNPSKNSNKHLHTGIFRNGTKGKNVKKNKNTKKEKLENVVSKARLVGDVLKLFDGESETICLSEVSSENKSTNQLSNKELVRKNSERASLTLKKSPVLGKNESKNRTKLEDTFKKNKEAEIVFESIDIPEVVIDQNFGTERTMKRKKRNEKKNKATHSEHSKTTSYNWDLHDSYMKLCTRMSNEYKNVLNFIEDPLAVARKKLKAISVSLQAKHTQHETVQELSNSKSTSSTSEHQACTYFSDAQSSTIRFPKNKNRIRCSESNQSKKDLNNFSIEQILAIDSNSRRDERYFDISIIPNSSKLPPKKRYIVTTPRKESPTQFDDKDIITIDCNVSNNIRQKYLKEMDRCRRIKEKKFCETDFANMFQNLSTPSTVSRRFCQSREPKFRNESTKIKYSEKFEKPDTELYTDVSNRENEVIRFRNCMHSQAPLEVLTAAATYVEAEHLSQTEAGNIFTNKYIPISSNRCNSLNQQSSSFYCSQNAGPSNFNVEPMKQGHCASQNTHRCEEKLIYVNCSNHDECNISQACHEKNTETARTITSGCSLFPIHYSSVANNYVNRPNNAGHTRILSLVPKHYSHTYPQQIDDHQPIVCLQNLTQPVKYFALDNGVNARKIPLFVKDSVCKCQDHNSICPH